MKKRNSLLALVLFVDIALSVMSVLPLDVHADIQKYEILPSDDTYVANVSKDVNYGTQTSLYIGRYNSEYLETWLRFDLSGIPKSLTLKSATLKLYRRGVYGRPASIPVQTYSTGIDWNGGAEGLGSETTLTWANKPPYDINYTTSVFFGNKFSTTSYTRIPLNVTDVVRFSKSQSRLLSLSLRSPTQKDLNSYIQMYSKEEGSYVPTVELVFSSEGTEPNSQVAVLIDRSVLKQADYERYAFGVGKWLEWWKMDYEEIDVSSIAITRTLLSKYRVIFIPQFKLADAGNLDSAELQAIYQAVSEDGVGLVQVDAYLQSYVNIWSDYVKLFNVTLRNWVTTKTRLNLVVVNNSHFISEIYRSGIKMNYLFPNDADWKESDLVFQNVTVADTGTTLAVMQYNKKDYPAIIARAFGNGKVVLSTFSTGRVSLVNGGYDGFGERANAKTISGMHGLLWRSIVWTAKKPFVFMGMPPFLTFRVDDIGVETSDLTYVDKLLQYGFFVNLYLLQNDAAHRGTAYLDLLRDYYLNGSTHISPHAWDYDSNIYWDGASNTEYSGSTLSKFFSWLDANYSAWGVTPSALTIPHFYQTGANAVPFLKEREWLFTSSIYQVPYSAGVMTDKWIWDADWKRIAHLDYADDDRTIFNVDVEMPVGNPSYATQDCLTSAEGNAAKATKQILSSFEHGLADLFWAEAFTHEQLADTLNAAAWDKVLTWTLGNITQYPFTIKASKEYIARYVLNRKDLSISGQDYVDNTLTLNISGNSTLPVALYLFTDSKISSHSGMLDYFRSYGDEGYMVWLPPFSGAHQAAITFGDTETELPHVHFTSANVTSTFSSISQLTMNAKPVWKHDKPLYEFEINASSLGQPESITYFDGTSIDFDYNSNTKIVSFNKTLSGAGGDIQVTWPGHQPTNHWQMTFDHKDIDGNSVDSLITWELYKGTQRVSYTEGKYTLLDGAYTLKTLYNGKAINQTELDTTTYGNTTITINLQMKPHTSVIGGYVAFNNTITSLAIHSQTDENLTFTTEGLSPTLVIADVPRNLTYLQRNDVNQTGWRYARDLSGKGYAYFSTAELSKWELYFPQKIEPVIDVWQFTFDYRDLDANLVDSRITWRLYNGSNALSYREGEFTLLNGTYTLRTYYHGFLINQTLLDTADYGNSTITISLQMKPHQSTSNGYIAFNNTITSIAIDSQTGENLTFAVQGPSPTLIIVDVPRNCSYIKKDGTNQTGWKYVQDLSKGNYTYIGVASLSMWEYYFPPKPPVASAVFGKTTIGASTDTVPVGYVYACKFQAPADGYATTISAYIHGRYQSGYAKAMIYSDVNGVPGALLYESNQITLLTQWAWHNFTINYGLQSGKYYWFAIFASVESQYRYDAATTNQEAVAWGWTYPSVPTSFSGVYGPAYYKKVDSIYVTYTPS